MTTIIPLVAHHRVQYVEHLLFSRFPRKTKRFYEILGYSFQTEHFPLNDMKQRNKFPLLRLVDSDQSMTGFRAIFNVPIVTRTLLDPDKRIVEFADASQTTSILPPPCSAHWITLLRTQNLEETKKFYEFFGTWKKERHELGPIHYSSKIAGMLLEIYPPRKKYPANIEFVVCVENRVHATSKLKKMKFSFLEEKKAATLFKDPDDRLVQIWQQARNIYEQ